MAQHHSTGLQGHRSNGVRGLDHMERGVRGKPERSFDPCGVCIYGPVSKSRHHIHLVRSWIILAFIVFTIGAASASYFFHGWKH